MLRRLMLWLGVPPVETDEVVAYCVEGDPTETWNVHWSCHRRPWATDEDVAVERAAVFSEFRRAIRSEHPNAVVQFSTD